MRLSHTGVMAMSRPRSYRHDHRCPDCGSNWVVKYGHSRGKQTYRCQDCVHRFSPSAKRRVYPEKVRQQAVSMYCEGNGVEVISRVLEVKTGTIYSWIKKTRTAESTGFGRADADRSGDSRRRTSRCPERRSVRRPRATKSWSRYAPGVRRVAAPCGPTIAATVASPDSTGSCA